MVNMDLESLADKYSDDGKLFEAEDLYKRLLNANPKNTNALYKLAFINVGKLDYNIAEMLLSAALKIGADIKILKLLAYVKEKQYQLYDAIVMYEQILELEKSEELFVITGNLYIQLELYDNAIHLAKEYVKMGCYISIPGTVTFKNNKKTKEVAKEIPLEYLLIETDSPYMAPEPHRGKRNDPSLVAFVADKIAQEKGISYEKVCEATKENAKKLFNIK